MAPHLSDSQRQQSGGMPRRQEAVKKPGLQRLQFVNEAAIKLPSFPLRQA